MSEGSKRSDVHDAALCNMLTPPLLVALLVAEKNSLLRL